jgi:hypothetical protein
MDNLDKRILAFSQLGKWMKSLFSQEFEFSSTPQKIADALISLKNEIENAVHHNAWFTKENVEHALTALCLLLDETSLKRWLSEYPDIKKDKPNCKRVGVVMAGNIPMVGFHDFLCVLITGHSFTGKLSSNDNRLLPAVAGLLITIEPEFADKIEFREEPLKSFDAVIATGSNNTSRYFNYYFGKYPNIIRKNRNAIAVLDGKESAEDLQRLSDDIFLYFGLGCRNVSKLYIRDNFDFDLFFKSIEHWRSALMMHNKYMNNYSYNRSIYLVNEVKHLDNGFLLLKEAEPIVSPISVLNYEYYTDTNELEVKLNLNADKIQCIVSSPNLLKNSVVFGKSQSPNLNDYADGVDTLRFLLNLH